MQPENGLKTISVCHFCGAKDPGLDHENSSEHQLATARLVLNAVERFGVCPYCPPKTKIKKCTSKEHAESIAYCLVLVTEEQGEKKKSNRPKASP